MRRTRANLFLAGIKQLVNQILFVSNVAGQQICDEQIGKGVFAVKHVHHGLFLDSQNGAVATTAALREATEETGISRRLLQGAQVIPLGHRSYDRPFDIRVAWDDMRGTDIKKGDLFAVSTQGFCVKTTQDLSQASLKAGDDAKHVIVATISSLMPNEFGIPDHLAMIQAVTVVAHVRGHCPFRFQRAF